jgi:hypothetical protein
VTPENAPAYDRIGVSYSYVRRADPRFEAVIWEALGDAKTVLNIGAGAGGTAAGLADHDGCADRGRQRGAQRFGVVDLGDAIPTLAVLRLTGALELDQMRSAGLLLAQLQSATRHREIGVALSNLSVVLRTKRAADRQRARGVRVACLALNVSPLRAHFPDSAARVGRRQRQTRPT